MSTFIMYFVSPMSSISIGTQSSIHHKLPHPSSIFFFAYLYLILYPSLLFSLSCYLFLPSLFLPFSSIWFLLCHFSRSLYIYSSFFPSLNFPIFLIFLFLLVFLILIYFPSYFPLSPFPSSFLSSQ